MGLAIRPVQFTADRILRLHYALNLVAGSCDGAYDADGIGFNKDDTDYGRRLAYREAKTWTRDDAIEALRLCRKYRRQLSPQLLEEVGA